MIEKARERLIGIHKTGHPIHLIVKIFLCWDNPVVTIHMKQKYIQFFFPFIEVYAENFLHKFPWNQFSNHFSSKSLTIQPDN